MTTRTRASVILADVNVLVCAFDEDTHLHEIYRTWLTESLSGAQPFALVDSVLAGFVRVVTSSRIYERPTRTPDALDFVDALIRSQSSTWINSNESAWRTLSEFVDQDAGIRGNRIPDAYLAALAIANGAQLATADRGFSRYRGLTWFDPAEGARASRSRR
jgi:uncharacterized protein